MTTVRPIWGMGRAGWFLAPVAAGLGLAVAMGVRVEAPVTRALSALVGVDPALWITGRWNTAMEITYGFGVVAAPGFNVLHLCLLLVSMHIAGVRLTWRRVGVASVWAVVSPVVAVSICAELFRVVRAAGSDSAALIHAPLLVGDSITFMVGAGVFWFATRSRVVAGVFLVMGVSLAFVRYGWMVWYDLSIPVVDPIAAAWMRPWVWNGVLAAVLLVWALLSRRRAMRAARGDDVVDAAAEPAADPA